MPLIGVGELTSGIVFGKGMFSVKLQVNDKMIKNIEKPPKGEKFYDKRVGNYYCFGPFLKGREYEVVGRIGNDVAQVGIILLDGITKQEEERIKNDGLWTNIFRVNKKYLPWDDRKSLARVRTEISPRILFVGETVGGDVGCDVLIHRDKSKNIDSIILDNRVFNVEKEE